jgi:glutaredoxin
LNEVTLYTKPGCHLCEDALAALRRLRAEVPFEIRVRNIEQDETLLRAYFERIPVIAVDGVELCDHFLDEEAVRQALLAKRA